MDTVIDLMVKKIVLPWLLRQILKQAWYRLKKNPQFQRLVIVLFLIWQLKTTRLKSLPDEPMIKSSHK
ncbi:MAG TPA: hypothetical protein VK184_00490 [Nostocaceae cyanobacterium]|nr:hypothetical protein [Nostocaceae cyanobacterium]